MILVLLIIIYFSIKRYKETTLITASTLLFLPHFSSGIPGVKLLYLVCIFQTILFYSKGYNHKTTNPYPLWLAIPSIMTSIGYLMSNYYGINKNISIILVNCICYFFYPYIIWNLLKSPTEIKFFLKSLLTFFFFTSLYALTEMILRKNYIADFCREYGLIESLMGTEDVRVRFGFVRCNSIFSYSSALGMLSSLIFFIIVNLKSLKIVISKKKENILLFLLPFCVILSGTRSQMVVFFICLCSLFLTNNFYKNKISKYIIAAILLLTIFFGDFFINILTSILDSNKSRVEGSSTDLRIAQYEICYQYFCNNPIWGNGRNYIWEHVRPYHNLLFGAESVWFQLMVDYGLVGCINYLLVVIGCIVLLKKYSLALCLFPIAFLTGKTLSIVIGVEQSTLLILTILLIKIYKFKSSERIL